VRALPLAPALAALVSLPAAPAWALCPNCLGQSSSLPTTLRLVGLFLLVPPAVFATVALVVRRIVRQSVSRQSVPPSTGGGDQAG
jgi:hypothetical protein